MRRKYVEIETQSSRSENAHQRRGENGAGWLEVILYTPIVLIGVYSMIGIGLILGG